jgi:hypothetical protein
MSSQLHAERIRARQLEIAAGRAHAEHEREPGVAGERPRRVRSTSRRRAVAIVVACAVASASVAFGAVVDRGPKNVAPTWGSGMPVQAHHARVSRRAFALRIRQLEADGYVQASCVIRGTLMINPHTHRKEIVFA